MHPFLKIKEEMEEVDYEKILQQLKNTKPIIMRTIKLFSEINYPEISRETDYLSLHKEEDYAYIQGKILSNTGKFETEDYKKHLVENIKEYATSKFVLKEKKRFRIPIKKSFL